MRTCFKRFYEVTPCRPIFVWAWNMIFVAWQILSELDLLVGTATEQEKKLQASKPAAQLRSARVFRFLTWSVFRFSREFPPKRLRYECITVYQVTHVRVCGYLLQIFRPWDTICRGVRNRPGRGRPAPFGVYPDLKPSIFIQVWELFKACGRFCLHKLLAWSWFQLIYIYAQVFSDCSILCGGDL